MKESDKLAQRALFNTAVKTCVQDTGRVYSTVTTSNSATTKSYNDQK